MLDFHTQFDQHNDSFSLFFFRGERAEQKAEMMKI